MVQLNPSFYNFASSRRFSKPISICSDLIFGGRFPTKARTRILIYHQPNAISWSLVHPWFQNVGDFAQRYGAYIRTRPIAQFLAGEPGPHADIVLIQPWIDIAQDRIQTAVQRYHDKYPHVRLVLLDGSAHCDLRFARGIEDLLYRYQRKALFRDRSQFLRSYEGDTNLTEYYGRLYGIQDKLVNWNIAPNLLDRLSLVPNFLTAKYLSEGFQGPSPQFDDRPIDLHSRIALKGSPWYSLMRMASDNAAKAIPDIRLTPTGRIPRDQFLDEMRRSRLCWSPFGYGELCWRDLEAFMTGAVLIKPDMSHLTTTPDLYQPNVTYLPVKWDFSNLSEVVHTILAQPDRQRQIAENAFLAAQSYLREGRFVTETAQDLQLA